MVQTIAAARKRGRSRSDSNTRPGSKKIPVRVCPVDIAPASVVSETGSGGGGGDTKSVLLGSLIVYPPLLIEDGEKTSVRFQRILLNTPMIREVPLRGFKAEIFYIHRRVTYFGASWPEVQSTSFSLRLRPCFPNLNLKVGL
jgi:hypothetical protein